MDSCKRRWFVTDGTTCSGGTGAGGRFTLGRRLRHPHLFSRDLMIGLDQPVLDQVPADARLQGPDVYSETRAC